MTARVSVARIGVALAVLAMPSAVAFTELTRPVEPVPVVHTPEGQTLVIEVPGYYPTHIPGYATEGDCHRALLKLDEAAPAGVRLHCEVQA
jgi:hypothetical protein